MQEVGSDEQDVTDHLAHTNIAQQLQEAATSNVTQGQRANVTYEGHGRFV